MKERRILIVEDQPEVLEGLSLLLEDEGYTVTGLEDGEMLQETLEQFEPNVILMDVWLPGRSGVRLVEDLKKSDSEYSRIPVILMSAKEGVATRAAEARAEDYLQKPFSSEALYARVAHWTSHAA